MGSHKSLTRLSQLCCSPYSRGGRGKLTISSFYVHPEPEALLSMVVQLFGCREETTKALTSQLIHLLAFYWPLNSPSCTHTCQQTDTGTKLRKPSVTRRSVSRPAVYLITAAVRGATLLAPRGYILAGEVLHKLGELSRHPRLMSTPRSNEQAGERHRVTVGRKTKLQKLDLPSSSGNMSLIAVTFPHMGPI